jgi:hypothetical protein
MMSNDSASQPTRRALPLILIRGFGGLSVEDERQIAYQGFNDGTVYPQKRGENYIYEGLILRLMKSDWEYHDATNVVGYYADTVRQARRYRPSSRRSTPASSQGTRSSSVRPWPAPFVVRARTSSDHSGCSGTTT